jgi:hypothetical protein
MADITVADLDNRIAYQTRIGRTTNGIVAATRQVRQVYRDTTQEIYDAIGPDVIESQTAFDAQTNRRKARVRLDTAKTEIRPVLSARDNYISRQTINEYNVAYYEYNFAANYMNVPVKSNPSKIKRVARFETPNNKLTDSVAMATDRNRLIARLERSILTGIQQGKTQRQVVRDIDIVLGFRTRDGELTDLALRKIESGELTVRGGEIYNSTRVARTEMGRMHAWAALDAMLRAQQQGFEDNRLQLLAIFDDRTRPQSADMHLQVSRPDGKFLYPNNIYYYPGQQPAQWAINDREVAVPYFPQNVFEEFGVQPVEITERINGQEITTIQNVSAEVRTWQQFADQNNLRVNRYGQRYNYQP